VFAVALELGLFECVELHEETLRGADGFVVAELGGWGEEAVLGVVDDLGDGLFGFGVGIGPGEVEARDLEAVEEEAGAARVDFVGGDLLEHLAERLLDGGKRSSGLGTVKRDWRRLRVGASWMGRRELWWK
jgi:hypothetical protein